MLSHIVIDNFATIEHVSFSLGDSLNIITGETGAGKSVLVQAINTALGGRADISMVRNGTDKATIQIAGEKNGDEVVITRELLSSGKSVAKLNGQLVTLSQLREFCKDFVDIHGQYDNQQILDPENHIIITDSYNKALIEPELSCFQELYNNYREARRKYDDLLRQEKEALQQKDFYEFEYSYISNLNLRPGEDDELSESIELMKNSEKIYQAVQVVYDILHEDEFSVLSSIGRCENELSYVSSCSQNLSDLSSKMQDVSYQLQDISDEIRDLSSSLTFSEEELDSASERLSLIEDAKRKYHKDIDEILAYSEELDQKLSLIQDFDYEKQRLKDSVDLAYQKMYDQADKLSGIRKDTANSLEDAISCELKELDFANSEFKIEITKLEEIGPLGFDNIEFLISTNPGEPLLSLTKIASGGEISRIMLALKGIIGDTDSIETMVFDEIDTGISGKTALTVGKKLREIASHHQILCITHLPQIAAYGNDNFLITKNTDSGKSCTTISHLDSDAKEKMLATLFSGSDSESATIAARELISKVNV